MIKSITVTNRLNQSIELELRHPEKSGFLIQSITGLGPVKSDINSKELATGDGSIFNSARMNSRNIVMDLKFLWSPTIEAVRLLSYKYFPIKQRIRIMVETDARTCYIYGYVESNEPDIFSNEQGCLVSIICPDPHWIGAGYDARMSAWIGGLSFPLTLPMTFSMQAKEIIIDNTGEATTPVTINFYGPAINPRITNVTTNAYIQVNRELLSGEKLTITTSYGNKTVILTDSEGVETNVNRYISRDSTFWSLVPGKNTVHYEAEAGEDQAKVVIDWENKYVGV